MYFLINMNMAKQLIGIGTLENDGTGDTLRVAFDKVNDNFTEAYNFDINQLANVDTSANGGLANGKVLAYDSSSGKFEPSSLVYASTLTDLADVTIASPATGEVIRYNGTNFVNTVLSTTNVNEGTNLYYTDARADARAQLKITALIDGAPAALDTLNELAAAVADDASYATTITTALAGKEPTITGGSTAQYWRGDKSFQTLNTSIVPEVTNLYYTNARADARIAAANIGDLANVDTTGVTGDSILKYHAGSSKFVIGSDVASLANLSDTTITTPATNSVLQYNGSVWIDATQSTSNVTEGTNLYYTNARTNGRIALHIGANLDLTQVATTTLPEGTNLYYTNARADARIGAASIGALTDVTITSAANGDILKHNGTAWVDVVLDTSNVPENTNLYYTDARVDAYINASILTTDVSEGTNLYHTNARADARADVRIAASSVNALNDVTITGVANNEVLQYNSGSSQWVNVAQSLGGGGVSVTTESFSGNNVATAFTLTTTGVSTNNLIVSVSGVVQRPVGAYSVSGQTLTFTAAPPTGTNNIEVRCLATGEPGFLVISASQAVVVGGRYAVNTAGGAVTCTLPASPLGGDAIYFIDAGGAFATNNLTIARNGNTIKGVASDFTISVNEQATGFVYNGATWRTY